MRLCGSVESAELAELSIPAPGWQTRLAVRLLRFNVRKHFLAFFGTDSKMLTVTHRTAPKIWLFKSHKSFE